MKNIFVANSVVIGHATAHDDSAVAAPVAEETEVFEVGDGVAVDIGWTVSLDADGKPVFAPPTTLPLLTPTTFYMAFSAQEMILIKTSVDPLVKEFYARYQVALEAGTPIDPNLVSVKEGLEYLASPTNPGPGAGILASVNRIPQILAGTPQ